MNWKKHEGYGRYVIVATVPVSVEITVRIWRESPQRVPYDTLFVTISGFGENMSKNNVDAFRNEKYDKKKERKVSEESEDEKMKNE